MAFHALLGSQERLPLGWAPPAAQRDARFCSHSAPYWHSRRAGEERKFSREERARAVRSEFERWRESNDRFNSANTPFIPHTPTHSRVVVLNWWALPCGPS